VFVTFPLSRYLCLCLFFFPCSLGSYPGCPPGPRIFLPAKSPLFLRHVKSSFSGCRGPFTIPKTRFFPPHDSPYAGFPSSCNFLWHRRDSGPLEPMSRQGAFLFFFFRTWSILFSSAVFRLTLPPFQRVVTVGPLFFTIELVGVFPNTSEGFPSPFRPRVNLFPPPPPPHSSISLSGRTGFF